MTEVPSPERIAVDPQLGIVALLDFAVLAAGRTVLASYPDLDLAGTGHSDPELDAARALVDECEILLRLLESYIAHVQLRQGHI